jgi:hypothetical protein
MYSNLVQMKKWFSVFLLLATALLCLPSCDYNFECAEGGCLNGSECIDGSCICPNGFEGTACETPSANKFIHNGYANNLFCADTTYLLQADIKSLSLPLPGLLIIGLIADGDSVQAYANEDSIFVSEQIYGDGTIKGLGLYENGTVSITLQITDGSGGLRECVAVLSR